ncbi:MAG: MCE family protein [Bacteroidota bacterium]|jgi:phospholipid/cholesterol/gamma-HCH transport system substrate-binding protein|nr:MCE family protein [Bacteroidota bacterium]
MTFSKEAKIGILTAAALLIFFVGFYFLKGTSLFYDFEEYTCYYDNVQGLQNSSLVQIKGFSVGKVASISLASNGKVKVVLAINPSVKIPTHSVAKLVSADLLGTKAISLQITNETTMIEPGSEIASIVEGGLMENVSSQFNPIANEIAKVMMKLNVLLENLNNTLNDNTKNDIQKSISTLKSSLEHIEHVAGSVDKESSKIAAIITNTNNFTKTLSDQNNQLSATLKNFNVVSEKLAAAPLDRTIQDLQKSLDEMQGLLQKVNKGEGSIGKAFNDKEVYDNANKSIQSLNALLEDVKAHPARYFSFSIIGKKATK